MCTFVCVYICRGQRLMVSVFLSYVLLFFFVLFCFKARISSLGLKLRDSPASSLPSTRFKNICQQTWQSTLLFWDSQCLVEPGAHHSGKARSASSRDYCLLLGSHKLREHAITSAAHLGLGMQTTNLGPQVSWVALYLLTHQLCIFKYWWLANHRIVLPRSWSWQYKVGFYPGSARSFPFSLNI